MGLFWKDMDSEELLLRLNVVEWGLKEKCHSYSRMFDNTAYVVFQIVSDFHFETHIKPGMLEARKEIKRILKERKIRMHRIKLIIMTEDECFIRELGWESFKRMSQVVANKMVRGNK